MFRLCRYISTKGALLAERMAPKLSFHHEGGGGGNSPHLPSPKSATIWYAIARAGSTWVPMTKCQTFNPTLKLRFFKTILLFMVLLFTSASFKKIKSFYGNISLHGHLKVHRLLFEAERRWTIGKFLQFTNKWLFSGPRRRGLGGSETWGP